MSENLPNPKKGGRSNARLAGLLGLVVAGMIGMSFAAVPLYDLFCAVTGYGGTTQRAEALPENAAEGTVRVRFNGDVNKNLPWSFYPEEREVEVKIGEPNLIFYTARNDSARPTIGQAIYNVTPFKAGPYFHKVQCFCFEEQKLEPGEEMRMGVNFYVDPAILDDPEVEDMSTITLSYTFFRHPNDGGAVPEEEQISHVAPELTGTTKEQ